MGLEPTTQEFRILCSSQLSYTPEARDVRANPNVSQQAGLRSFFDSGATTSQLDTSFLGDVV